MGGSALLIYGSVSDDLLQPQPAPRSLVDRLLGRARTAAPVWSPIGASSVIDLPAEPLKGLASLFTEYVASVAGRSNPPWTATASVLEYLRLDVVNVYVRGERSGDSPAEWYVQLGMSGCAGMAEVSSELAAHWADRWYRENQTDLLTRFLTPYGFEPDGRIECVPAQARFFVPFGAAGYALFNPAPGPADDDYRESRFFEMDAAALETLGDGERAAVLRTLDELMPPTLPSDSCCCQLCAPDFDAAACDRLVPF